MSTKFIFANNAGSRLAAPILSTDLTFSVSAGDGALFPAPGAGQYFCLTVSDAGTGLLREIMHVTNVTGDVFTVVRAQEGTTAKNYAFNDLVANLWTAGQAAVMAQNPSDALGSVSVVQVYAGNPNGHVAGNAAVVGTSAPSLVWDTTDLVFWLCTTTGNAAAAVWIAITSSVNATYCGTSTGSGNAQLLTPTIPITLVAGTQLAFIAGFTNTSAMTLNASGTGAKNVFKESPTGPIALTGGEVVAGNLISVRYDGTRYQLTATELGTAALANASSNTGTVAAVSGATTVGHLATFSDTAGTINDTVSLSSAQSKVAAVSGAFTVGHLMVAGDTAGTVTDGGPIGVAAAPTVVNGATTLGPGVYEIDTSAGGFTIDLLAGVAYGASWTFIDIAGTFSPNNFIINLGAYTLTGPYSTIPQTGSLTCNVIGVEFILWNSGSTLKLF